MQTETKTTTELPAGELRITTITATDAIAVSEVIAAKALTAAKGEITVGKHEVDVTVRVVGTITKGEDYDVTPTTSVPLIKAMCLLLRHCGITREAALNKLQTAMREALENDISANDTITDKDVKDMEARVKASLAELPKVKQSGKVTTKLFLTKIA